MKRVFATPLEYAPGSRSVESDLGMILAGELVARAGGHTLDQFLTSHLLGPLGMTSTMYGPPQELWNRIAPTENDSWRKRVLRGEVDDENAYALGGIAGDAGLFGSAHDLAVFAQLMLNRGLYDHQRYFKPETVGRFTGVPNPKARAEALIWQKPSDSNWTGKMFSAAAFGQTGFTGTSIWIDPERQLFIVLLTNRIHPNRDNDKISEARQTITASIFQALGIRTGLR